MTLLETTEKALDTLNNALDTVQSIEGILREARTYAAEANETEATRKALQSLVDADAGRSKRINELKDGLHKKSSELADSELLVLSLETECAQAKRIIDARDKRVTETEVDNADLLKANHALTTERDELKSEITKLCRKITSLESEVAELRAKSEPGASGIGEPNYGVGWEKCSKEEATEACLNTGGRWGAWLDPSLLSFGLRCNEYRFRRPITKPAVEAEPQCAACTAEEAANNWASSEWLDADGDWRPCKRQGYTVASVAHRSKAHLTEWVTVTAEVWESKELEDCERQRESTTRVEEWDCKVKRADVTIGTVLG